MPLLCDAAASGLDEITEQAPRLSDALRIGFWNTTLGLVLTVAMMVVHGSLTVLGHAAGPTISGVAGLGHYSDAILTTTLKPTRAVKVVLLPWFRILLVVRAIPLSRG
ncbi:DUF2871 family protein [Nocardia tengchongensis]|uniref:DUF2871 family protein n=1 Tax=Nocardia tengchongensis TaxID=2055889 RepID=UPI00360BA837